MADPTFKPVFRHLNWIDNVDPITATGGNGLNARFDAIAGDLRQLSTVVTQIDAAIDVLAGPSSGGGTIGREPLIDVPVSLLSTPSAGPPLVGGWSYDGRGVAHPDPGPDGGRAVMGIQLPNGIRITSFQVRGGFEGGSTRLVFQLGRARVDLAAQVPDILATIDSGEQSFNDPYNVTVPTVASLSTVDLAHFRYFVTALGTGVSLQSTTSLAAVHLGFVGSPTD
jgi:hypothetical protein